MGQKWSQSMRRVVRDGKVAQAVIAIAEKRLDQAGFAEMFRRAAVSLP